MHLRQRLAQVGLTTSVVSLNLGYELRGADPIPYDLEYTRDLGYCAAQFLLDGGTDAMVTLVDGHFRPQPFSEMLDPRTGRTRVRLVDVASEQYEIARGYMVRLGPEDFADPDTLASLARTIQLSPEQFRERFAYLVGQARVTGLHS
jgi:6-phosphofructokinase 1